MGRSQWRLVTVLGVLTYLVLVAVIRPDFFKGLGINPDFGPAPNSRPADPMASPEVRDTLLRSIREREARERDAGLPGTGPAGNLPGNLPPGNLPPDMRGVLPELPSPPEPAPGGGR